MCENVFMFIHSTLGMKFLADSIIINEYSKSKDINSLQELLDIIFYASMTTIFIFY